MHGRRRIRWSESAGLPILQSSQATEEPEIMTAQAIPTASLICAGRARRAAMLREAPRRKPSGHVTEFQEGMLGTGRRQLGKNELLNVQGIDATLVCLAGELWLTRRGDAEDHILGAGGSLHLGRADRAVVQALQASRVRLIPA
jgi:hypothetical protein